MIPLVSRRPAKLPVLFSPIALYYFDGASDVTDQSGNARTLTIATTPSDALSPVKSKKASYAGRYTRTDAALRLTGSMTALAIVHADALTSTRFIAGCGVPGASGATNVLWSLGTNVQALRYFAESGASGTDTSLSVGQALLGEFMAISLVRTGGTAISLAINGVEVGSGTCTAPDTGGSSVFSVGGDSGGGNLWAQTIDQLAVYGSALTPAQLKYLTGIALRGLT